MKSDYWGYILGNKNQFSCDADFEVKIDSFDSAWTLIKWLDMKSIRSECRKSIYCQMKLYTMIFTWPLLLVSTNYENWLVLPSKYIYSEISPYFYLLFKIIKSPFFVHLCVHFMPAARILLTNDYIESELS